MTVGCWRQKLKFDLLSHVIVGGSPPCNSRRVSPAFRAFSETVFWMCSVFISL